MSYVIFNSRTHEECTRTRELNSRQRVQKFYG